QTFSQVMTIASLFLPEPNLGNPTAPMPEPIRHSKPVKGTVVLRLLAPADHIPYLFLETSETNPAFVATLPNRDSLPFSILKGFAHEPVFRRILFLLVVAPRVMSLTR